MHIVAYLLVHLVGQHFLLFLPDFLLQLPQPTLAMSISQPEDSRADSWEGKMDRKQGEQGPTGTFKGDWNQHPSLATS